MVTSIGVETCPPFYKFSSICKDSHVGVVINKMTFQGNILEQKKNVNLVTCVGIFILGTTFWDEDQSDTEVQLSLQSQETKLNGKLGLNDKSFIVSNI